MKKPTRHQAEKVLGIALCAGTLALALSATGKVPALTRKNADSKPQKIELDLDRASSIPIPTPAKDLAATQFKAKNGWPGWVVKIPGDHPIATPAVYEGKIYAGGGYGSHEFYCFDGLTGAMLWKYQTDDDGPSAAVVDSGCAAFNTESCTVYVLDARTGALLWKEWLGDPLMSQPAIAEGKLFMAYPGGQRGGKPGHRMLCADLRTGKHIWEQEITADVITAPIVDGEKVYFTCMDGTSFALESPTGRIAWKKSNGGTSAPVLAGGRFVVAEKSMKEGKSLEGLQLYDKSSSTPIAVAAAPVAAGSAPYLQGSSNGTIGPQGVNTAGTLKKLDAAVGFGGGAPAAAQLGKATNHMGISSVAGAWGYQGAKAFSKGNKIVNAQGVSINSVDAKTGKLRWRAEAKSKIITGQTQVFSPPSLGKENMYLVSGDGHLVSIDIEEGKTNYCYKLDKPVSFQPALWAGNIYLGTANGMITCLKTSDPDTDGWTAWGGNARHNKQN